MTDVLPRSFLYVPADKPHLFDKGACGPADAIVLDLEDAVPVDAKDEARENVRRWLTERSAPEPGDTQTWVRVSPAALAADLDAAVQRGVSGIFLAKCTVSTIGDAAQLLDQLERDRRIAAGSLLVVGLVESAVALRDLGAVASAPRLTTLGIGEADLLADLRMTRSARSSAALDAVRTQIVVCCAASGRQAPVAPTSTAFRDLEAFGETSRQLLDLGFRSRTAIHPGQVPVINEIFSPTTEDVEAARDVVARFDAAGGGVTTDAQGRLIDAAVVRGARETLERATR